MKLFVSLLALSLFATACSSGGGGQQIPGSELPPLKEGERTRMTALSREMGTATQAATRHMNFDRQGVNQNQVVINDIDHAVASGACSVAMTGMDQLEDIMGGMEEPTMPGTVTIPQVNIDWGMNGRRCPVHSDMNINFQGEMTMGQTSANGNFQMGFSFSFAPTAGSSVAQQMDLLSLSSSFGANINFSGNQNGGTFSVSGEGVTLIHTKDSFEGNVEMRTRVTGQGGGNQNGGSMTVGVTTTFLYSDFTTIGYMLIQANQDTEEIQPLYYINGEPVTEEEYMALMSPGMDQEILDEVQSQFL